jgi:hypothetical protein
VFRELTRLFPSGHCFLSGRNFHTNIHTHTAIFLLGFAFSY